MKHAVVKKGRVIQVFPWTKVLPDGTTVTKELPPPYRLKNGKHPDVIKEVPDNTQVGWFWNEETQEYGPREKVRKLPPKPHSDLLEVVAEKLGLDHDDLFAEVMARKRERTAEKREAANARAMARAEEKARRKGLTPPDSKG